MLVLIVEAEPLTALDLAHEVEAAGHTVVGPATNIAEALELIGKQRPTLGLVDTTLECQPTGIEFARTLRELGIPSIFLSAQPNQARANSDAALGFIAKPWKASSVSKSLEVAATILAGYAPPSNTGDLEVFPAIAP